MNSGQRDPGYELKRGDLRIESVFGGHSRLSLVSLASISGERVAGAVDDGSRGEPGSLADVAPGWLTDVQIVERALCGVPVRLGFIAPCFCDPNRQCRKSDRYREPAEAAVAALRANARLLVTPPRVLPDILAGEPTP